MDSKFNLPHLPQATPGQLTFLRDMVLPTSYIANWELIQQQRQHVTDINTIREKKSKSSALLQSWRLGINCQQRNSK
jgi:hypothetical protein